MTLTSLEQNKRIGAIDWVTESGYTEVLTARAKAVEIALCPVERQRFQEPFSWADEYLRVLKLFEVHIKP